MNGELKFEFNGLEQLGTTNWTTRVGTGREFYYFF